MRCMHEHGQCPEIAAEERHSQSEDQEYRTVDSGDEDDAVDDTCLKHGMVSEAPACVVCGAKSGDI